MTSVRELNLHSWEQLYGCVKTARSKCHHKKGKMMRACNGVLTNWTMSTTGTLSASLAARSMFSWPTNDHNLSRLSVGQKLWLRFRWKFLMPTFPKYPGWYLSKLILWWCIPPALPRPPGCLRCLPEKYNCCQYITLNNFIESCSLLTYRYVHDHD